MVTSQGLGTRLREVLGLFFVFETESYSVAQLECSGKNITLYSLDLLGSTDPPTSASQVAGITGMYHHGQLIFVFLVETVFHHVGRLISNS